MDFKVGIEGTYGCADFRGEVRINVISHMMRVVVTDRTIAKIANIRHGVALVKLRARTNFKLFAADVLAKYPWEKKIVLKFAPWWSCWYDSV